MKVPEIPKSPCSGYKTDEQLVEIINHVWRMYGYDVNARLEKDTKTGKVRIVSDTIMGLPVAMFNRKAKEYML